MRELTDVQKQHFTSSASTLCWAWKVTRNDGVILGFTDHDADLDIDGVSYEARSGFDAGALRQETGFSINTARIDSVFDSDKITQEDLRAGLYDGAQVDLYRVNWKDVSSALHMGHWRFGETRMGEEYFEVELLGRTAQLDRTTGRVFSSYCDAEFGDDRCGLNRADFPEGTICPRSYSACQNQFQNNVNFRGFPYLIGDDAMTRRPQLGEILDGGSRFK